MTVNYESAPELFHRDQRTYKHKYLKLLNALRAGPANITDLMIRLHYADSDITRLRMRDNLNYLEKSGLINCVEVDTNRVYSLTQ